MRTSGLPVAAFVMLLLAAGPGSAAPDPALGALLEKEAGSDTSLAGTLNRLEGEKREQREINVGLQGDPDKALKAAQDAVAANEQFQADSKALQDKIDTLLAGSGETNAAELRDIAADADALQQSASALQENASIAAVGGAGSVFETGTDNTLLIAQGQIVSFNGASVTFAAIAASTSQVGLGDGGETLGSVEERLRKLRDNVGQFAADGDKVAGNIDADGFKARVERLKELERTDASREQEIRDIQNKVDAAAGGGEVLAAFAERLAGGGATTLGGDAAAGARVAELAEGLVGAGQRIAEIKDEKATLEQENADLAARGPDDERLDDLNALLAADEQAKNKLFFAQAFAKNAAKELEKARKNGDAGEIDQLQQEKSRLDRQIELLKQVLNGEGPNDQERLDLFLERKALNQKNKDDFKKIIENRDKLKALNNEAALIAALQAELADLIRNGAPLDEEKSENTASSGGGGGGREDDDEDDDGDAKDSASVDLDRFLEGSSETPSDGSSADALDGSQPDAVEQVAANDPLGLDQFGFDADQGATEGITGFDGNGGGNNGLFPCPPGSTAFPPGFLIDDIASCFF